MGIPFPLVRRGVKAKHLPRRVFGRSVNESARPLDARAWRSMAPARVEALAAVLEAIDGLESHADRMHVLAAVAALHDDPDEAAWFLSAAVEDDRSRCGRCGRAAKVSRWRRDP